MPSLLVFFHPDGYYLYPFLQLLLRVILPATLGTFLLFGVLDILCLKLQLYEPVDSAVAVLV